MDATHWNPCCCITLKSGTIIASIVDVLYSVAYFTRVGLMDWMISTYHAYYPKKDEPTYFDSSIFKFMCKYGVNVIAATSSILLLFSILCLPLPLHPYCSYTWLSFRLLIFIISSFHVHHLIMSNHALYSNYGYEVLVSLFLYVYLSAVVFNFAKDAHDEHVTKRKIAAAEEPTTSFPKDQPISPLKKLLPQIFSTKSKSELTSVSACDTATFLAKRKNKFTHHRSSLDEISSAFYVKSNPSFFMSSTKPSNYSIFSLDEDDYESLIEGEESWDDISTAHYFAKEATSSGGADQQGTPIRESVSSINVDLGMDNVIIAKEFDHLNLKEIARQVKASHSNLGSKKSSHNRGVVGVGKQQISSSTSSRSVVVASNNSSRR